MHPIRSRLAQAALVALFGTLALAGCKKKEADTGIVPPVATVAMPPPATPGTVASPVPTTTAVGVTGLELGNAAGADMKITAPTSTFAPKDKIIAAVSTSTADPNATVPGKLAARWSHLGSNQVVNQEERDIQFRGAQVFDFQIENPQPWPAGKYKVEVMLDGNTVQVRQFEVK
jgi:hypothetical protein